MQTLSIWSILGLIAVAAVFVICIVVAVCSGDHALDDTKFSINHQKSKTHYYDDED